MSARRLLVAHALMAALASTVVREPAPVAEAEPEKEPPPETTREWLARIDAEARAYRVEKPTGRAAQRRLRQLARKGAKP